MERAAQVILRRQPFSDYGKTLLDILAGAAVRLFGDSFAAAYAKEVKDGGSGASALTGQYGSLLFYGDGAGVRSRHFGIREMMDAVGAELRAGTGCLPAEDGPLPSKKAFGRFGSRYGKKTVFKNLTESAGTAPERVFLLHMSAAFQLDVEECELLLKNYGYHPLHAKSPLDMAVLVALKSCGKNRSAQNNCFEKIYALLFEGCRLYLLKEAGKKDEGLLRDVPDAHGDSTTVMIQRAKNEIDSGIFPRYMAANFDVFNERHSKLLAEYSRLIGVLYYLFNDGERCGTDPGDKWKSASVKVSFFHCYRRFLCLRDSYGAPGNAVTHFFTRIVKNGYHPTREVMIWLWIYEYCLSGYKKGDGEPDLCGMGKTVEVKCPHTAGLRFLDFMIKKQKELGFPSRFAPNGEGLAELLGIGEEDLLDLKTWGGTFGQGRHADKLNPSAQIMAENLKNVFHSEFDTNIERARNSEELMRLNIGALLGNKDYVMDSPWDGSALKAWLNHLLETFRLEPLNANRRFDAAVLGLCDLKMTYSKERRDYRIHFYGRENEPSADFWFAQLTEQEFRMNPYQDSNRRPVPTRPVFSENVPFRLILVRLYIDAVNKAYGKGKPASDRPSPMPLAFHPCEING